MRSLLFITNVLPDRCMSIFILFGDSHLKIDLQIDLEIPFRIYYILLLCLYYIEHVLCTSCSISLVRLATSPSWNDAKPPRNAQRALWCSTWSVCWSATLLSSSSCCSGKNGRFLCVFFPSLLMHGISF